MKIKAIAVSSRIFLSSWTKIMDVKSVAMCPPTHFTVKYKINPWMGGTVDRTKAQKQFDELKSAIQKCGVEVKEIEPVEGLPDMVFCCNSGIVHHNKVYLAKFRHPERREEQKYYKRWFENNGYEVFESFEFFEGGGDAVISRSNNKLWAGHGPRTTKEAYNGASQIGKFQTILCELTHPSFYHMDTCFALLTPDLALWFPDGFSAETQTRIKSEINLISVPEDEANKFICNSICFGKTVIAPPDCPSTKKKLEEHSFNVVEVDMSEFMKSGGACQCLVLKL